MLCVCRLLAFFDFFLPFYRLLQLPGCSLLVRLSSSL
jgi:hypothetical protein